MTSLSIKGLVKDKYDGIIAKAEKAAIIDFENTFLKTLEGKTYYERTYLIDREIEFLKFLMRKPEDRLYFEYDFEGNDALQFFANRYALLGIDDSELLYKAAFNGKKCMILFKLPNPPRKSTGFISFEAFIEDFNNTSPVKLDYCFSFSDESDDKILAWQTKKFIDIVDKIAKTISENIFKVHCSSSSYKDFFTYNINHYESLICQNSFDSVETLINEIKKFSFIDKFDFDNLSCKYLLYDFENFKNNKYDLRLITPLFVGKIENNTNPFRFSNEMTPTPILFYIIRKIILWMESVLKNGDISFIPDSTNYEDIYYKVSIQSDERAHEKIAVSPIPLMFTHTDRNNIIPVFQATFKSYRYLFNELNLTYEYISHLEDRRYSFFYFVLNSFFSSDPNKEIEKLASAMQFSQETNFYQYKYDSLFSEVEKQSETYQDILLDFFYFLLYDIAVDYYFFEKFWEVQVKSERLSNLSNLPDKMIQIIFEPEIDEIFYSCLDRLKQHLDNCDLSFKKLYITSMLNSFKELEFRTSRHTMYFSPTIIDKYRKGIRDFLQLENDFIKEIEPIKLTHPSISTKKSKLVPPAIQNSSFGYKNKNTENFRNVITQLCNEIDMLNSDKSSITDFINVLLSKNLQDGHRPILLNCKTNLFAYIIRNIDRYFHSLTPAIIEKSGLFYSSNGNPIKAQNLYSNKTDTPNKKKEVDDILKQLQ